MLVNKSTLEILLLILKSLLPIMAVLYLFSQAFNFSIFLFYLMLEGIQILLILFLRLKCLHRVSTS